MTSEARRRPRASPIVASVALVALSALQACAPGPDGAASTTQLGPTSDPPAATAPSTSQQATTTTIDWESLRGFVPEPNAEAPRLSVFGDSSAMMTALGLGSWASRHPDRVASGGGWTELGCGTVPAGTRIYRGERVQIPDACEGWVPGWAGAARGTPPDVAVVQFGPWEVVDMMLPGDTAFRALGDPALDAAVRGNLTAGVEALLASGAVVVLVEAPAIEVRNADGTVPQVPFPESDAARMRRFNEIQRALANEHDSVGIVELGSWLAHHPEDARLRPDGVHFTWDTATEVAAWLGPEILSIAEELEEGR